MSISGIIGEQAVYEGLMVGILNEGEGAFRIVIMDSGEKDKTPAKRPIVRAFQGRS